MGVVATNVLRDVWNGDNDEIENTATSDTNLLVLKGQVKMELLENNTHKFTGLSWLSLWVAMADLSLFYF